MSNFNEEIDKILEEQLLAPRTKNFLKGAGKVALGAGAIAAGLNPWAIKDATKAAIQGMRRNYEIYLDSRDKDVIRAGIRLTSPRTLRSNDYNNFLSQYGNLTLEAFLKKLEGLPRVDTSSDTATENQKNQITISPEVKQLFDLLQQHFKKINEVTDKQLESYLTKSNIVGKTIKDVTKLTKYINAKHKTGYLNEVEIQRRVYPATSGIGAVSVKEMTIIFDIVLRITAGKTYENLKHSMTLSRFVNAYYKPFVVGKARRHAPAHTDYFNM